MKICIDLDGVINELKQPSESYAEVLPKPGAAAGIKKLREAGHYIIIATARHMKTCDNNIGRVIAKQGMTTLNWLQTHKIEYDEIHFGKPHAQVYIDDNALRFESWDKISPCSLPLSSEQSLTNLSRQYTQIANVVMPLAGKGSRFENSRYYPHHGGYSKPLIDVAGRPMLWWALKSLKGMHIKNLIFVVLKEHILKFHIDKEINAMLDNLKDSFCFSFENIKFVVQDIPFPGMLCSVLEAGNDIELDGNILILGGDTYVQSNIALDIAETHHQAAGLISTADLPGDRWSFARTDSNGVVVEVAEKNRISDNACTGMYYFRVALDFLNCADMTLKTKKTVNGEYYIMPVYEHIISHSKIRLSHAQNVWDMGTPKALDQFLANLRYKFEI